MQPRIRAIVVIAVVSFAALAFAQEWAPIGPNPMQGHAATTLPNATGSGLVSAIAIDPSGTTDSTMYVATAAGGVWKTTDGGASWKAKSDYITDLHMGAIALDPSNPQIVYAGNGGGYCCNSYGGVYRSIDGGDHWKSLNPNAVFQGTKIFAIVVPVSGTVLVATKIGLFKSVDSGEHFGSNAPKFDNGNPIPFTPSNGKAVSNGKITDLKTDTLEPKTIYAAVNGVGLFKSVDHGSTFPASGQLIRAANFPAVVKGGSDVWITMAQSTRPDNRTIYAFLCSGVNPGPCAVMKSVTRGSSFSNISVTGFKNNQGDFDQVTAVDPQDPNRIYLATRRLYYDANGGAGGFTGANLIDGNGPHGDYHAIVFSPASHFAKFKTTRVYLGSDGGLASTAADGSAPSAEWRFHNHGLATMMIRGMDFGKGSPSANLVTYGAAQDNGVFANSATGASEVWQYAACGDSNNVAVDPTDPQHAIATCDSGSLNCITNGQPWRACGKPASAKSGHNHLLFDPNGQGKISYAANGSELLQSTQGGKHFVVIETFTNTITAMSQVAGSPNLMWLALADGSLRRCDNILHGCGGPGSLVVNDKAPKNHAVTGIAIDPTDPKKVVIVYPGFSGAADPPKHVFLTTDSGSTWKNIGGVRGGGDNNISDQPLYSVVILPTTNPHTIIVGSDVGVQQSGDNGQTWQVLGGGLPRVQVTTLVLDSSVNPFVLRAATFGRSAFQLVGPCPLCAPPPQCSGTTGCNNTQNWFYQMKCTGRDVGIVYNGDCRDTLGGRVNCIAGFNGSNEVSVGWGGWAGPPQWLTAAQENNPEACTRNNTGQLTCRTFTIDPPASCSTPVSTNPPPPRCGAGEVLCAKFQPPMCVPAKDCTYSPLLPPPYNPVH